MKSNEIRDLTTEQIVEKIHADKKELLDLSFRKATGSLENPMKIKDLRKEVARLKTILREREIEEAGKGDAA